MDAESSRGYDLTHKFLAMRFLQERNCLAGDTELLLESKINAAAESIAREQALSEFDDLFSERAAFLYWGGFRDLVKEEWIDIILENQDEAGSWTDFKANLFYGNPHTTVLAVWALVQSAKSCPF